MNTLAHLGESWVQLELAKRDYYVSKVHNVGFDFLGENGLKLEVKSALPSKNRKFSKKVNKCYEYTHWQFRVTTKKQQNTDYFICVPFETLSKCPLGYFVFPKEEFKTLGRSDMITVFESDLKGVFKTKNKTDRHQYLNKWQDVIQKFINQ